MFSNFFFVYVNYKRRTKEAATTAIVERKRVEAEFTHAFPEGCVLSGAQCDGLSHAWRKKRREGRGSEKGEERRGGENEMTIGGIHAREEKRMRTVGYRIKERKKEEREKEEREKERKEGRETDERAYQHCIAVVGHVRAALELIGVEAEVDRRVDRLGHTHGLPIGIATTALI